MTTPKKIDTDKLKAEILSGRHDRDLTALLQTVRARVDAETSLEYRWKITLPDIEWTEDDVTLAEIQVAERVTGLSWLQHRPLAHASHLAAYLFAGVSRRLGLSTDEAQARVDGMTREEVAASVGQYVKVDSPKDDPSPSEKP